MVYVGEVVVYCGELVFVLEYVVVDFVFDLYVVCWCVLIGEVFVDVVCVVVDCGVECIEIIVFLSCWFCLFVWIGLVVGVVEIDEDFMFEVFCVFCYGEYV